MQHGNGRLVARMFGLRTAEVIQKTNNGLKQLDEELSPEIVRARLGWNIL